MASIEDTRFAKTVVWCVRIFQLVFAAILIGCLSYIIDEIREFAPLGTPLPREVITPEVFSILAILFTSFGLAAIFFFDYYTQLTAAFLDFAIWVGYITCSGLLRHNYQSDGDKNPLERYMNAIRRSHGARGHQSLNGHLVRLVSALVVIQIILYFFTIILSIFVARNTRIIDGDYSFGGKQSRFSFSRGSGEKNAAPVTAV